MEKTEWLLGNISILEPTTAITDLIITVVCIIAFVKLKRISKANYNYLAKYPYFFLTMGLCTFFAALMTHAFPYTMVTLLNKQQLTALPWNSLFVYHLHDLPNWVLNVVSASLFEWSLVERATDIVPSISRIKWISVITIESVIVVILLLTILSYNVAAIHIVFTLYAILTPLQFATIKHLKNTGYQTDGFREQKLLLIGAAIMLISGPVMATKFQLSPWFNHNDISHIIIAISMFIFYKSAVISTQNEIVSFKN